MMKPQQPPVNHSKVTLYDTPPRANHSHHFMDSSGGDFEKVDMILESPHAYGQHHPSTEFVSSRVLGTLSVVAITYMLSTGGPIGSEPVIAAAGPLIGMAGFVFYPLLVVIPYAFIIAELCSAFPEDGGFTIWVLNAFGPFWGFQLVTEFYAVKIASGAVEYVIKAAIAVLLTVPTFAGARNVGLCAIVVVVFIVFTIWAYTVAVDFDDLFEIRHEVTLYNPATKDAELSGPIDIDWETYVNTLYWNYDGIIMLSVFGGEILNPARVYPRAIMITVLLMMFSYIIPMPAGLSSDELHWSMLTDDSYPLIAKDVGGRVLETIIVIAAMCSTAGMDVASLYAKSFQLSGMAENVLMPTALASKSARFDAPHNAILLMLVLTLPLLSVEYKNLLPITNAFSAAVQLIVIATAFTLRVKLPYIPRSTKVPGGQYMVLLFAVLPAAILCYILYHAFTLRFTALVIAVSLVPGLVYGVWQLVRHRNATMDW
ncbi:hypothetical protein Gpo141_00003586 [Globisporangium polare]